MRRVKRKYVSLGSCTAAVDRRRRQFLRDSTLGLAGLASAALLTPSRAATSLSLDAGERRILARMGELILPGARIAGIAEFVETQLQQSAERQALMIKYLGVAPPFATFYRSGLAALDGLCRERTRRTFVRARAAEATALIRELGAGTPAGWSGPPAGLFYFVVRNDALDVVYGTRNGFLALATPYMAHIAPPSDWPT